MVTTIANAGNQTPEELARNKKTGADAASSLIGGASSLVQTGKDGAKVVTDAGAGVVKQVKEKGIWGTITEGASSVWNSILGFLGMTGDPEKDKKGLNVGSLLGGFLGAGGGWAISQALGGGIFGTIAMIAFIPMGIIIGTQFGDKNINPLIGREPHGTAPAKAKAAGQSQQQTQPSQNQNVTTGLGPNSGEMYQQFRGDIRNQYPNLTSSDVAGIGTIVAPYSPGRGAAPVQTPPGQPVGWRIGG